MLQVGGLVVKRLCQVDSRLGSLHVGSGTPRREILRADEDEHCFACRLAVEPAGVCAAARSLIAAKECQVKNGSVESHAGREQGKRSDMSWDRCPRGKTVERKAATAKFRRQVQPLPLLANAQIRLWQQGGA